MMRFIFDWIFFSEVTTQQKCQRILDKIADLFGCALSDIKIERYWKDETKFKIQARSSLNAPTAADGLFLIMTKLNHLAPKWVVGGPAEDGSGFSGTTKESIRIDGLNW